MNPLGLSLVIFVSALSLLIVCVGISFVITSIKGKRDQDNGR